MSALSQYLIPLLVFTSFLLISVSAYLLWGDTTQGGAQQTKSRIRRLSAAAYEEAEATKHISLARQVGLSVLDSALLSLPPLRNFDRFLEQSGVQFGPASCLVLCLCVGVVGSGALATIVGSLALAPLALGFLLGCLVPLLWISRKRKRRQDALVSQIPDTLDFFARSVRAGTPFSGAIKIGSEELPQPIAGELSTTFDELNFGLGFDEAMHNLAARVDTGEIRLFVTAVLVQKSTGGNLAEFLNRLSKLLRDRITAAGEIRIQAAEMRSSARLLVLLPIIVAGLLYLINPDYFTAMLDSRTGKLIVTAQACLMGIGYFIIHRMVSFRI